LKTRQTSSFWHKEKVCRKRADLVEKSSTKASRSTGKTGNKLVTVKRVFLQLWSDRLLHCGERESFELSGQAGEREPAFASSFSLMTFKLCRGFTDSIILSGRTFGARQMHSSSTEERVFIRSRT
jgi:hypothetical protein